jgi:NADH-quinone oxidoreductase subunit C
VETVWIAGGEWTERARALADDGWLLVDLAGVDRVGLPGDGARFEVVVQLLNLSSRERQMLHVAAEGEPPTIPSVVQRWPGADFMEREAFDMFGIVFEGHPNLTRILMPDEWEGHPLRKDYGVGKVPVEFADQPFLQIDTPGQAPDGGESRVDLDRLGQPQLAPASPSGEQA